jgi:hypothetical protein
VLLKGGEEVRQVVIDDGKGSKGFGLAFGIMTGFFSSFFFFCFFWFFFYERRHGADATAGLV